MSLDVTMDGPIAVATFRNAANMNSFDTDTLKAIRATIEGLLDDDTVAAIVLTGEGKAFSTGADVAMFQRAIDDGSIKQLILDATAELHPLMVAMHRHDKPIVAAVNGVAAGGGLGLALAADVRIGNPQARFAAGYFGIGASPDGGATWFMPRLMGTQRSRRFFFENQILGPDEALASGVMDELVADDDLLPRAVAVAKRWAASSAHSRRMTNQLLETTLHASLEEQLEAERQGIAAAGETAEFAEGVGAFLGKRKPRFNPKLEG